MKWTSHESKSSRIGVVVLGAFLWIGCGNGTAGGRDGGPAIDATASEDAAGKHDGLSPVLSSFRVTDGAPNRLYFDSNEPIVASTVNGFTVSDKTITAVSIEAGQTTGHYFTVSEVFTFWDNNTIRYEGGSDVADTDGNGMFAFTLTYIENEISEPVATVNRYVTTAAVGSGDGTSEANAWTLQQALANAEGGQTVWVQAGNYGNVELVMRNRSGTAETPLKFIGYDESIGDITEIMVDQFSYTTPLDSAMFIDATRYPVLDGDYSTGVDGLTIDNSHFIIIKNIQIKEYENNIMLWDRTSHVLIENIATALTYYGAGNGVGLNAVQDTCHHIRFSRILSFDNAGGGIRTFGSFNAIVDSAVYCGNDGDGGESTDYYISWYKSDNSIMHNNRSIRVGDLDHRGHTYVLKTYGSYNLISNNYARNISENLAFAREGSHHNVAKYNTIEGDTSVGKVPTAMVARAGAHDNVYEFNRGDYLQTCIANWQGNEDTMQGYVASKDNIFRNNFFSRFRTGVGSANQAQEQPGNYDIDGVLIHNNTFVMGEDGGELFVDSSTAPNDLVFSNCEFTDNNIYSESVTFDLYNSGAQATNYAQSHNNYYNAARSYDLPAGEGNLQVDPEFTDATHYLPTNVLLKTAVPRDGVEYDHAGTERDRQTPTIGAVEVAIGM